MSEDSHVDWLLELTNLPTAAGREGAVVAWVRRWAKRRKVELSADPFGNLLLQRSGVEPTDSPIFFTAHMDHPAFVVVEVTDPRQVVAEFRGGVPASYFQPGTPVRLHHGSKPAQQGKLGELLEQKPGSGFAVASDGARLHRVDFDEPVKASVGDVVTWDVGDSRIDGDRLHAPACDDLAGVAAALAAFDVLRASEHDVRVLLTRAEETGFIGAIAAAKHRSVPRKSRLICLENSKSFPESPIGGGPIVRVGDYTSTFNPDLTYRCGRVAQELAANDSNFKWQRKLMPGGTCEASAFHSYGYIATCLCLPLGNYHNMNDQTGRIDAETISISDYRGLVRVLAEIGKSLDDPAKAPSLRKRLDDMFANRKWLVNESGMPAGR